MSGFTFPLEAALRQRERQEQVAQRALAETISAYGAAMAARQRLERERAMAAAGTTTHLGGAAGSALAPQTRMSALYYLDRCAQALRQQHGVIVQWEQEVQRRRAQLVEASQRKRALERLRERRAQEYDRSLQRRLDAQLDELVTLRYQRATRDGEPDHAD